MKQEVKLNVSNDRPVAFMGELVLNETTRDQERKKTRWSRIQIYATDRTIMEHGSEKVIIDGLYMIGIGHITYWMGERDQYWVEEVIRDIGKSNAQKVVDSLKRHTPDGPLPEDTPHRAKEKEDEIKDYLDLVDWISKEIEADEKDRTENTNPDNTGDNKADALSA